MLADIQRHMTVASNRLGALDLDQSGRASIWRIVVQLLTVLLENLFENIKVAVNR